MIFLVANVFHFVIINFASNMVRELFEKIPKKVPHFKEVMKLLRFLEDLGRFLALFL